MLKSDARFEKSRPSLSQGPARISDALNRRLTAYAVAASAAGVAVLACSPAAEAAPVCKTLSDKLYFTRTYPLYLGEQAAPPFNLAQTTLQYTPSSGYAGLFWWNRDFLVPNSAGANVMLGPKNFPANLAAGSAIGPAGQFGKGQSYGLLFTYGRGYPFDTRGHGNLVNHLGNFDLQKTNFVGFSFTHAGQVHYGWVRLRVTFRPKSGGKFAITEVLGWGYEQTPNTAIAAGSCTASKVSAQNNSGGDKTATDLPAQQKATTTQPVASLGMLAAGNLGRSLYAVPRKTSTTSGDQE